MPQTSGVFAVPEMSTDPRVRVFRRTLSGLADFEGMEVDAYIVLMDQYAIVLDTLLCPEDVSEMMQAVQDEVAGKTLLCVNSHADWDHTWGNRYFSEHAVPILASTDCLTRMRSEEARKGLADYQARYPLFRNVEIVPPTITFNDRLSIVDSHLTLELLPAPGHHLDQIVAWLPEIRLLLAFDAVEKPLPCIENAACAPHMFETLERLVALHAERVLCSHGKSTSPALVKENLAYLREIEQRCRVLLQTHRPTRAEMEHASTLIDYPFDEVIAGVAEPVDRTFYSWAHENNVRAILEWIDNAIEAPA